MWLRHFRHKRRTKTFKEFRERYYAYLPVDCVDLCSWHHAEIHSIYIRIISARALRQGACRTWTWQQAHSLIQALRAECIKWLGMQTPGLDPDTKREFHNETI